MNPEQLDLLREALPYIQRFKNKIFVVKISGQVTESAEVISSLAAEISLCHQVGFLLVIVHGGGRQLTELAEKMGIRQTIVEGRRVTDQSTLEIAKMVFAGKINTDILSALRRLGTRAVGLSGLDGNIIRARRREIQRVLNQKTGLEELVDYGHVGDIVDIDGKLLQLLLEKGYVPVISSLGADDEGNVYNINADTIAAAIAVHLKAEKLIALSNVDGIYRNPADSSTKISRLTLNQARAQLASGEVEGGMIPKLTALVSLLEQGVQSAHIINGLRRNALLEEIFTDHGNGTMLCRD